MATTGDFIEYVYGQIAGVGNLRDLKMFGEYMVYVNEKPLLLVCDNVVYIKKLEEMATKMQDCETGFPYQGAKEHYILDIDDGNWSREVITMLEKLTPVPKPKKKKAKV